MMQKTLLIYICLILLFLINAKSALALDNPGFTIGSVPFQSTSGLFENNSNFFWDNINNRLGIGTNTPTRTLDINNSFRVAGNKTITGEGLIIQDDQDSIHSVIHQAGSQLHFRLSTANPISGSQDFLIAPYNYGMSIQWLGTLEFWVHDISFRGYGPGGASNGSVWVDDQPDLGGMHFTTTVSPNQSIITSEKFNYTSHGSLIFQTRDTADNFIFQSGARNSESTIAKIDSRGNLYLANGSDIRPLTDSTTGLQVTNSSGTSIMNFDTTDSSVGIGTLSVPTTPLEVFKSNNALGQITVSGTSGQPKSIAGINFKIDTTNLWQIQTDNGASNKLFIQRNNNSANRYLTLDTNGQVGIGTTTPASILDVSSSSTTNPSLTIRNTSRFVNFLDLNGNTVGKIQGGSNNTINYASSGTDFAEWFIKDGSGTFDAGTVVVSGTQKQSVAVSTSSYDPKVLGIITSSAAFTGGVEGSDKVTVALLGQVLIKIDPNSSAISVGDPLTSADTPGMATKATQNGPVVAKALESWAPGGASKIMAYVNVSQIQTSPTTNYLTLEALEALGVINLSGDLSVNGRVEFADTDMGGFAKIPAGSTEVNIVFNRGYSNKPIVNITPQGLYDIKYAAVNTTVNGFTIKIDPALTDDVLFNWTAISIKNAQTTIGATPTSTPVPPTPTPTDTPVPTDTPTPDPTVTPTP